MDKQENTKLTYDNMGKFVMIPHAFIRDAKDKRLSYHARWLFVALRYYTNGQSGVAFPSYSTINKLTGLRREKIASSIIELEEAGWLTKQPRFGNSSIYTLTVPQPEELIAPCESAEAADLSSEISEVMNLRPTVKAITVNDNGVVFGGFDPDILRNAVEVVEMDIDDPDFFEGMEPFIDYCASQRPE
jgi:hypothetical protein